MENRYTLAEVARILGVSKNTIKYRVRKLSPEMTEKIDGIVYLSSDGLNQLKNQTKTDKNRAKNQQEPEKNNEVESERSGSLETIQILKEQLDRAQAEIDQKNEQILHLMESLKAEQTINIQSQRLLAERNEQILKLEAEKKPRGFLSIFRRNKSTEAS